MSARRRRSRQVVERAFERDNPVWCEYCGRRVFLTVQRDAPDRAVGDHRIPLSRGGLDRKENVAIACYGCNHLKGALTADEFLAARHDHAELARLRAVLATQLNGADIPMAPTRRERHEAKKARRKAKRDAQLAYRLQPPSPACAVCYGQGEYWNDRGRHMVRCPCTILPADASKENAA